MNIYYRFSCYAPLGPEGRATLANQGLRLVVKLNDRSVEFPLLALADQ